MGTGLANRLLVSSFLTFSRYHTCVFLNVFDDEEVVLEAAMAAAVAAANAWEDLLAFLLPLPLIVVEFNCAVVLFLFLSSPFFNCCRL